MKNPAKKELADAAWRGILEFIKSTRGSAMLGSKASMVWAGETTIQIRGRNEQGPIFFTIKITENVT